MAILNIGGFSDAVFSVVASFLDDANRCCAWAQQYIERHVADPRGTGGTPYAQWLKQLIYETRAAKIV